jgi:hypothetical protein
MEVIANTPIVESMVYTVMPNNPWGWNEFFTGSLLGLYGPLNMRQRNYDCFGRTF